MTSLSLAPDGWSLISGGRDKVVHVWDLRKNTKLVTIPVYEALEGMAALSLHLCWKSLSERHCVWHMKMYSFISPVCQKIVLCMAQCHIMHGKCLTCRLILDPNMCFSTARRLHLTMSDLYKQQHAVHAAASACGIISMALSHGLWQSP